jgi:hypothetical protein
MWYKQRKDKMVMDLQIAFSGPKKTKERRKRGVP